MNIPPPAYAAAQQWTGSPRLQLLGNGHIHDTFLLEADDFAVPLVLQRVNEVVFQDAELVMQQTRRLLSHWSQQNDYVVPRLVPTLQGGSWVRLPDGLWRAWEFIGASRTIDPLGETSQAYAAGRAFGMFQHRLSDLSAPPLQATIPGFLQLEHYLDAYDEVAHGAPAVLRELIDAHRDFATRLRMDKTGMDKAGAHNTHIHGDCKVNNLLFDVRSDAVLAIIDFDTAMYGHWAWDFGDLVRSVWFSRGRCDLDYYAACLAGFASAQPLVNGDDAQLAPAYVALMLGVRFLTDHLTGDHYFRVREHGENLARARAQFKLLEGCVAQRDECQRRTDGVLENLVRQD